MGFELEIITSRHDNSSIQETVVYDGSCGSCETFADYLKKINVAEKLEIAAYQRITLDSIPSGLTENMATKAIFLVRKDGKWLR